ncbi:MAG: NAD(P)/FAD-dependent oxidoreductase [Endomicrobium sp.]|jgi:predicted Rossmann fold flavoprotein|uniref:NAD(P)/FAD-dependent oxidoreductase n=1 Tax=Candidatus Endomicrobiellum cubanum TaxID=3242325 RepID=UPI002817632F|nr:NAD(P)/FAD-dependent oxidoreductase [Endomicrobium sp.]MDR2395719.1 NAD(P)/FAD-dependent oxidoreductase [Endomicrobium sp.]
MINEIYDVCIIGAGPSGMMAAIQAGQRGLNIIVLEKKSSPGIKLSISGKGRCNITNSASVREFVELFYNGKFLYSSFHTFSNIDTVSFFERLNVPCKLERGGRYFPVSDKACDIVNALIRNTKQFAKIISSFDVKSVKQRNDCIFCISGKFNIIYAKNLIIASGGMSYPGTGSIGDGYKFAEFFGHSIKKPVAALVPIVLESKYLYELKSLKLKNIEVSLEVCGRIIFKEFGEMEFTSFGADGPVILALSSLVSENIKSNDIYLKINLKPAITKECLNARLLKEIDKFGQYQVKGMLKEFLPKQLIKSFLNYCNVSIIKKCAQLTKFDREKLLKAFFEMKFKVLKTKDIKDAIVTRGGVVTDEINQKTMESKLVRGLYFCGEVIDVDAPTGGFNLQAAFSTGFVAGINV